MIKLHSQNPLLQLLTLYKIMQSEIQTTQPNFKSIHSIHKATIENTSTIKSPVKLAFGHNFVFCVFSRGQFQILVVDSRGNKINSLVVKEAHGYQPILLLLNQYQVVVLAQNDILVTILVWHIKNNAHTKYSFGKSSANFLGLYAFQESRTIAVVNDLSKNGNKFKVQYFKVSKKHMEITAVATSTIQIPQKMQSFISISVDNLSSIVFIRSRLESCPSPTTFYLCRLNEQNVCQLEKHCFPEQLATSLPTINDKWMTRRISDIWRLDSSLFYIQISNNIIDDNYPLSVTWLQKLNNLQFYADFLWNSETQEVNQIKNNQITSKPHRIQFTEAIRTNLPQIHLEREKPSKRIGYRIHLTGMSFNHYMVKQDVPIYLFNRQRGRVVARLPQNTEKFVKFIWSKFQRSTVILISINHKSSFFDYEVWSLPLDLFDSRSVIMAQMMLELVPDCDEDLIFLACGLSCESDPECKKMIVLERQQV